MRWLSSATPTTADDRNLQLIGLKCGGTDSRVLQRLAKAILSTQRPDGGWSQRAGLGSDAFRRARAARWLAVARWFATPKPIITKARNPKIPAMLPATGTGVFGQAGTDCARCSSPASRTSAAMRSRDSRYSAP